MRGTEREDEEEDRSMGGDSRSYSLFTGCLIPSKFPFIEVASRRVLERLGFAIHDLDGVSCCPNQMAIQSSDAELWHAIAARNLAIAEGAGRDVLTLCNGCYDTLKTVRTRLRRDRALQDRVNARLAGEGLEFRGTVDVKHILQVLHDDIGPSDIDRTLKLRLGRLRLAPFVGCHVKRPMDHMGFDDPERPFYLRDLIKATGAKVVDYPERDACCGGGFSIARSGDAVPAARRVLRSVRESGGDALVVNCPYCFSQFVSGERKVKDVYQQELGVPVLYITQVIGLAMGMDPSELALDLHYAIGIGGERELVERIRAGPPTEADFYGAGVARQQLDICRRCLACVDDCQTAMTVGDYDPGAILDLVLEGRFEEAMGRADIWYCINCHECVQHCPQGFGMVKLLVLLKNHAAARGLAPEVVERRLSELRESGYSFAPDCEARAECGLEDIIAPDVEALRKLIREPTRESE